MIKIIFEHDNPPDAGSNLKILLQKIAT